MHESIRLTYEPSLELWEVRSTTRVGWPTIFKLSCWVCGTNPSSLGTGRAQRKLFGEPEYTEADMPGRCNLGSETFSKMPWEVRTRTRVD